MSSRKWNSQHGESDKKRRWWRSSWRSDRFVIIIPSCEIVSHLRYVANSEHHLFPLPVFNWKEKKLLRLSLKKNKRENIRIPPIGHLEDILHLFDESKGDRIIDEPTFRVEALPRVIEIENFRRQVDVSMLYGSGKSSGLIEKKRNVGKLKFSHSRVFGNKEISKSVQ